MPEDLVLSEPEQFRALGHPLRHRLMLALRQRPATLAQLATALGVAKGTVGYHVKILEQAGLVRVASTRRVRGGVEQHYQPTSERLRIAPDAPVGADFLVRAALGEMLPADGTNPDLTFLRHARLTVAQAQALAASLERFAGEEHMPSDGDAGEPYGLLVSLYRADVPVLPDDAG
ncbi:helix-turn-helix transcriptional regulator [Dactylosporangium aurantiacum]|uniref:Helix-turn-helix transcriptional regulator n=1 Tax=Dactylosporangium aurantiacum TaxID=35754 RepID=A0A9Q9IMT1_9ACTN|nr:winged helix-turn-helix domain-containing protein [Dactylosporangium aurantiacum]MDG6109860.1 winged helix-turn-helix domain-containing protein [Dactylosporangium aurantiacum]UWZ57843.1 helix-turn-helix transcriptional regulator [Dactylosporangium aurantiacum]